ncbi:fatty acid desaturase-domain-containing protein [Fomitopsis serialis]|uniref:fatty acid desaturase-domain-containing protein n=1 Tax=Fomitopsis serialis TaxID=139415 RepID=UPI0020076410|nr:fatty acid desaturase-domain-containing protein [Neoantrodia serialis]KAH9930829.1 fatty acid desaturase-domain-containing protein [Neoantrodia serialis]
MTSATEAKQGYSEDHLPQFTPMPWSLSEIRAAIPAHLHVRNTRTGLLYLGRDLAMAALAWRIAVYIDPTFRSTYITHHLTHRGAETMRWCAWLAYWWFQGLIFTGIWVIGHECGHGAFSANKRVCDIVGYITHTLLWTPYFSWQISHHRHHSNHASMERDEVYIPKTRSDLGIPKEGEVEFDYEDYFGDTPVYTLFMLIRQQLLAFPAYLLFNVSGRKDYPKGTNHFDPKSVLFTERQRNAVILSNIGIASMAWVLAVVSRIWGASEVIKYYGIPWLLVTHWFIMITYLHHTDMELPHYRNGQWNFQRGAAATVDRNFLGWQGRFFLHDVAHFHVIHHFFPMIPFYNGAEATDYLKAFIGDHYRYSDKPVFQALWETYNNCQFVEDKVSDILFYRDRTGKARVRPASPFRAETSDSDLAQQTGNSF